MKMGGLQAEQQPPHAFSRDKPSLSFLCNRAGHLHCRQRPMPRLRELSARFPAYRTPTTSGGSLWLPSCPPVPPWRRSGARPLRLQAADLPFRAHELSCLSACVTAACTACQVPHGPLALLTLPCRPPCTPHLQMVALGNVTVLDGQNLLVRTQSGGEAGCCRHSSGQAATGSLDRPALHRTWISIC